MKTSNEQTFGLFDNPINENDKIIQTYWKGICITLWFGRKYWTKSNYINSCKLYNESIDDKLVNDYHQFKEDLRLITEQEKLKWPEISIEIRQQSYKVMWHHH